MFSGAASTAPLPLDKTDNPVPASSIYEAKAGSLSQIQAVGHSVEPSLQVFNSTLAH